MGKKSDILTSDNQHLALMFNSGGIEVDKELPKYTLIKEEVEEFKRKKTPAATRLEGLEPTEDADASDVRQALKEKEEIKSAVNDYGRIQKSNVREMNIFINQHMFNDVFSSFNEYSKSGNTFFVTPDEVFTSNEIQDAYTPKKKQRFPILQRLSDLLKSPVKSKELEEMYSLNVIEFFAQVKGLTKANKSTYVDRLTGYIVALKNCDTSGQLAMKEKLLRDMVVNKYESVLYANDLYYVVTEDQIVDFVKKTEKGVRLTYIKNYMRVIPPEVVEKITKTNALEIFDNYAILHYDPDCLAYGETIEETKKRRDPILFGLIRGSNKLYYITDWIDEFCDLTLDKFVETLQMSKEALKMSETINLG